MPLIDHFGHLAKVYDRVAREKDPQPYLGLLGPPGGLLLDAGGGTGRVGAALADRVDRVIVADVSIQMLRQAAGKNGLRATCAEAESLPFAEETFDRIVMVDAFHHLRDQAQAVAELWRVLRLGGRMVIEEPDIRSKAVKVIAVIEKLLLMRSHIVPGEAIARMFQRFPEAQVQVSRREPIVYIQVLKKGEGNAG